MQRSSLLILKYYNIVWTIFRNFWIVIFSKLRVCFIRPFIALLFAWYYSFPSPYSTRFLFYNLSKTHIQPVYRIWNVRFLQSIDIFSPSLVGALSPLSFILSQVSLFLSIVFETDSSFSCNFISLKLFLFYFIHSTIISHYVKTITKY